MAKILVVDDNPAFTDLIEMIFDSDYEVFKAGNGDEGVSLACEKKPDVILMDIMMPRVGGVEMLRRLQADPDVRAVPVIIVSASHFDTSTQQMLQQEPNVHSFLKKPCAVEELRARIQSALIHKK